MSLSFGQLSRAKLRTFGFTVLAEGVECCLTASALGFEPEEVWNPSPSRKHECDPYPLPKTLPIGIRANEITAARFSPPPFAIVIKGGGMLWYVGVAAEAGFHLWNEVRFDVSTDGVRVGIDLEGMSDAQKVASHLEVAIIPYGNATPLLGVLAGGLRAQYPTTARHPVPDWWLRPIYCGWGDQVAFSLAEEGPGPESRALAYCIQGLYERWLARIDAAKVPIGTVTIDAGWSPSGVWVPDETRWPDLKGFIRRQHDAGRKVLLWIGLWIWDGLEESLSITGDGRQWCADPSNDRYLEAITGWVHDLLSAEGFDADGFKIDQLGHSPNRRKPRWGPRFGFHSDGSPVEEVVKAGEGWGIELLHRYQKAIYDAAKAAKPEALITSSTVHPYFQDTFDMVRLHDMGEVVSGDGLLGMKARADLARAALPGFSIDADDWIHQDYRLWLDYTVRSHQIGVPCLFYSERFVAHWDREPTTIPIMNLHTIAEAWDHAGPLREWAVIGKSELTQ